MCDLVLPLVKAILLPSGEKAGANPCLRSCCRPWPLGCTAEMPPEGQFENAIFPLEPGNAAGAGPAARVSDAAPAIRIAVSERAIDRRLAIDPLLARSDGGRQYWLRTRGRQTRSGGERDGMVILPRIARFLGHPGVASLLGVVLILAGVFGYATDDISRGWAILIFVVGVINVIHGVQNRRHPPADA